MAENESPHPLDTEVRISERERAQNRLEDVIDTELRVRLFHVTEQEGSSSIPLSVTNPLPEGRRRSAAASAVLHRLDDDPLGIRSVVDILNGFRRTVYLQYQDREVVKTEMDYWHLARGIFGVPKDTKFEPVDAPEINKLADMISGPPNRPVRTKRRRSLRERLVPRTRVRLGLNA